MNLKKPMDGGKGKKPSAPKMKATATIQKSTVDSRTGKVTKYPATEMKMKSISAKKFFNK